MEYKTIGINGLKMFYRETGDVTKPVFLLLHGFPTSSHMFRNLMLLLENNFHLIAPDYIGFGQSDAPDHTSFSYTFDNLTEYVERFLKELNIEKYFMYVFDYGAPIGFRLALHNPDKILGIVSQNGNIYEEGLGEKWNARKEYWNNPTEEKRELFKSAFAPATIISQYTYGEKEGSISPDGYSLDILYTQRKGYADIQSDLIYDYKNNVALYPEFQKYVKKYQPKLLAIWGKNDPSFIYKGAEAFKRDDEHASVILLDGSHFVLESNYRRISEEISNYFC